jgi:hypothetical protein
MWVMGSRRINRVSAFAFLPLLILLITGGEIVEVKYGNEIGLEIEIEIGIEFEIESDSK